MQSVGEQPAPLVGLRSSAWYHIPSEGCLLRKQCDPPQGMWFPTAFVRAVPWPLCPKLCLSRSASCPAHPRPTPHCRLRDPHQRGAPLPGGLHAQWELHRLPLTGGCAGAAVGLGWGRGERELGSCTCSRPASLQVKHVRGTCSPPSHLPHPPAPTQNVVWQEMDSKALKRAYGMEPHQKGVLVGHLAWGSDGVWMACVRAGLRLGGWSWAVSQSA